MKRKSGTRRARRRRGAGPPMQGRRARLGGRGRRGADPHVDLAAPALGLGDLDAVAMLRLERLPAVERRLAPDLDVAAPLLAPRDQLLELRAITASRSRSAPSSSAPTPISRPSSPRSSHTAPRCPTARGKPGTTATRATTQRRDGSVPHAAPAPTARGRAASDRRELHEHRRRGRRAAAKAPALGSIPRAAPGPPPTYGRTLARALATRSGSLPHLSTAVSR